jgi:hypothetical protein
MYEKAHVAGKELSSAISDNKRDLTEANKHLRESTYLTGKDNVIDKSHLAGNLQAASNELHRKGLLPGLNVVGFENKEHGRLILADKNHHLYTLNDKRELKEVKAATKPGTDAQKTNPGSDAQKTNPGSDAQKTNPGSDAQKTNPGSDAQKTNPGSDAQKTNPGSDAQKTNPGSDAPKTNPGTDAPKTTPGADAPKTTPGADAPKTNPGSDGSVVPKTVSYKTPYSGDQIWGKVHPPGKALDQSSDRQIWYATEAAKLMASAFGKTLPVDGASKAPDGTIYIKMHNPLDVTLNKSIGGGLGTIEGLHVGDGVTFKVQSSGNEVKYKDICGVSLDTTFMGYHMRSQVKEVKVQHAANGTTYIDATAINPLPSVIKASLHMPENVHIRVKVGADGVAQVDVASMAGDVANSMKQSNLGRAAVKVIDRYKYWQTHQ